MVEEQKCYKRRIVHEDPDAIRDAKKSLCTGSGAVLVVLKANFIPFAPVKSNNDTITVIPAIRNLRASPRPRSGKSARQNSVVWDASSRSSTHARGDSGSSRDGRESRAPRDTEEAVLIAGAGA